jgi:phage/plasmid-like protein (TIGR03299 family)
MAHELEIINGEASMAYNRTNGLPWHRLGTPMDGLQTPAVMLQAAKADYEVHKSAAYMLDPTTAAAVEVPGTFHTWRRTPIVIDEDGISGNEVQPLGTVSERYRIIQNAEALAFATAILDVSDGEAIVDTCGVLEDGATFFAYISLPDTVIDAGGVNDRHARGLGVVTGHDGKRALQLVMSTTRIVCKNTVEAALRSKAQFTVRHTGHVDQTMGEARKALDIRLAADIEFEKIATRLLGTVASFGSVERIADKLWGFDNDTATDREKTFRNKRVGTLRQLWSSDTNVGAVGANGWAAWNTLVEYMDHHTRGDDAKKATRAVLGNLAPMKQRALVALGA